MDPAGVETVFARVEQAIADLLNTVKAIEWRDGLKAVAAAAAVLDRHDIRAAAARAVAEVEWWIARQARSPTSGRQAAVDGREPNLGRRPTLPQTTSGLISCSSPPRKLAGCPRRGGIGAEITLIEERISG